MPRKYKPFGTFDQWGKPKGKAKKSPAGKVRVTYHRKGGKGRKRSPAGWVKSIFNLKAR